MKKYIFILLGLLMTITAQAASYTTVTIDNIPYRLYDETMEAHVYLDSYNTLTVANNRLELPETVKNGDFTYSVTEIEYFRCDNSVLTLVTPKTVTAVNYVKGGVKTLVLGAGVASVMYINESANLEVFEVDAENPYFVAEDGVLYSKDKKILWYVPYGRRGSVGSFTVPAGVEEIAGGAFYGFNKLESVSLPEGLKYIRNHAFFQCSKLTNCKLPSTVELIDQYAFYYCNLLGLELPAQLKTIGKRAFEYGVQDKVLSSLTIPQYVESIGDYAFNQITIGTVYAHCVPFLLSTYDPLGSPSNQVLIVPKGTRDIFSTRQGWKRIHDVREGDFDPTWSVADYLPGGSGLDSDGQIVKQNGVSYKLYNSGFAHVYCNNSNDTRFSPAVGQTVLTIPESVYFRAFNYTVDAVEYFETYNNAIVDLQLPNTVTSVGNVKSGVKTLVLGENVTSISGLYESTNLEAFVVAEGNSSFSVDTYGILYNKDKTKLYYAPYGKRSSFGSFSVPSSVTAINSNAFRGFDKLESVNLPDALKSIGSYAFYQCSKLTNCKLPSTVELIDQYAFYYCNLLGLELPAQLKTIGKRAFEYGVQDRALSSLTIPQYVESIGDYAFGSITIGTVYAHCVPFLLSTSDPLGSPSNQVLIVPKGTRDIFSTRQGWKRIHDVREGDFDPTWSVADYLPGGSGLDSDGQIVKQNGVSYKLYNSGFAHVYCNNSNDTRFSPAVGQTVLTIPESVYFRAFNYTVDAVEYFETYNNAIVDLQLPNTVTSVGNVKSGVKILKLPKSVTKVYNLYQSTNLEGFKVAEDSEYFSVDNNGVLYDKNKTKLFFAPYGKRSAFAIFTVPSTVTVVGSGAFEYFDQLVKVTLPKGLKEVGPYAFYRCEKLVNCNLPSTVESIGQYAFSYCNLSSLELPAELKTIGNRAFEYGVQGKSLPSLSIPQYVESIGNYAFNQITIGTVYSHIMSPLPISTSAFPDWGIPLVVPTGTKEQYNIMTGWSQFTNVSESDDMLPTATKCAKPMITPNRENNTITITTDTEGATIYYTTNGQTPTENSDVFDAEKPIKIVENCIIKAIAVKTDLKNSDVAEYSVDWFVVKEPTITLNDDLQVEMHCETEGAVIRYMTMELGGSADNVNPSKDGYVYTGRPLILNDDCLILAVGTKANYTDSPINIFPLKWSQYTCSKPEISVKMVNNKKMVEINTIMVDATIYYTIDDEDVLSNGLVYEDLIPIGRNCVIRAIVTKKGYRPSATAEQSISEFMVSSPSFTQNGTQLTITCVEEGVSIYYGIGEDAECTSLYTAPIELTDNRPVYAIGRKEGYDPSTKAVHRPTNFTCEPAKFDTYNGRFFTLNVQEGATAYYTTDGSEPTEASSAYGGPTPVDGLCKVRWITTKPWFNNSSIAEESIKYFFDNGTAEITEAGQLSKAMEWTNPADVTTLQINGKLNADDLAYIKQAFTNLEHLDLSNVDVVGNSLPEGCFAGMPFITFTSPKTISSIGNRILADCPNLAAVIWNSNERLTNNTFGDHVNPNMLVYVFSRTIVPGIIHNVIVENSPADIILVDQEGNNNFYCPRPFVAKKISYTHHYDLETIIGSSAGWETISLPFTVQKITHDQQGDVMPYLKFEQEGSPETGRPFWLKEYKEGGFEDAAAIEANTPYIISMPNNKEYAARYNLKGNVTFSAEQTQVLASTDVQYGQNGRKTLIPNFVRKAKSSQVYAINKDAVWENFYKGSVFVNDWREVGPFEAYIVTNTSMAPPYFAIDEMGGNTTAIDNLMLGDSIQCNALVKVYNMAGYLVTQGKHGEVMKQLPSGVYIVNGKKVVVK